MAYLLTYSRAKHCHHGFRSTYSEPLGGLQVYLRGVHDGIEYPAPAGTQYDITCRGHPKLLLQVGRAGEVHGLMQRIQEQDPWLADDVAT